MPLARDSALADPSVVRLVEELRRTGDLCPLLEMLNDGEAGTARARTVLRTLGERDLDLLVQIALDKLIDVHVALRLMLQGADDAQDGRS